MTKYWIQYKVWVGTESFKQARLTAKFVTTNDLQEWCAINGILSENIERVVRL